MVTSTDRHGLPPDHHARRSSAATCSRIRAGTRPTRRTSPRSPRAAWRRCSTSRPWSASLTRHGPGQRLSAGRGHRRGRGHDVAATGWAARPPGRPVHRWMPRPVIPRPSRWWRTRAEPHRPGGRGVPIWSRPPPNSSKAGVFGLLVLLSGHDSVRIPDLRSVIDRRRTATRHAIVAVAADPLALCVLTPAGRGWAPTWSWAPPSASACRMSFGGPHAAYIAVRESPTMRALPGRLVGVSKDDAGRGGATDWPCRHASSTSAARTGHLQHLHLAGAAGRDGVDVRHPSRTRGVCLKYRGEGQPGGRHSWPHGLRENGVRDSRHDQFFDTVCIRGARPGRQGDRGGSGRGA